MYLSNINLEMAFNLKKLQNKCHFKLNLTKQIIYLVMNFSVTYIKLFFYRKAFPIKDQK